MNSANPIQIDIFSLEHLADFNPLKKYEILFDLLPAGFLDPSVPTVGRPAISKTALLKVLIYKNLKPLPTLFDTSVDIIDNPSIALRCGLNTGKNPQAIKERLSSFIRDTPNSLLQKVKNALVTELINLKGISGTVLSIDSCPIAAHVRENNLKTSVKDRFDKSKILVGDPDARLGVIIHFKDNSSKKVEYFWGYRNHVVIDALSELPIAEITKPANVSEQSLFIPLFDEAKKSFHLPTKEVLADAGYDTEQLLLYIVNELKALPRVARNPRCHKHADFKPSASGGLVCIAGFEMLSRGTFLDRGRLRRKFVCPIKHSKKFAATYPNCPWNLPQFLNGNGCYAYLRADENIRQSIDYTSASFKKSYNLRTGSERVFSRLLTLCMQNPSVTGLAATANHCTIAHITVLLVALAAVKTGHKNKIRFVKKFLPTL
jgi:hypothetical protein